MKYFLGLLLFLTAEASPPLNLYQIDASLRGGDFLVEATTAFTIAGLATGITNTGEVVIQTHATPSYFYPPGIINGEIPFVQNSIIAAPNNTLFIIPFNNPFGGNQGNALNVLTQYVVIGIEQIVTVAYRYNTTTAFPLTGFISNYPQNVLPLFQIDPAKRAADIKSIVTTLNKGVSPGGVSLLNFTGNAQVWILTTLQGAFYVPFAENIIPNAIPNVLSVTVLSGGLLQITYQPIAPAFPSNVFISPTPSVIVAAEQVEQIIYFPNINNVSGIQ